uniref:Putative transcriptional repressor salm n=1 Tax=Culex tarsalis TaxID=7177 RepID=A0A1Q3EY51_CULTA
MEEDLLIVPSGSPESYCRLCFSEANVEPLITGDHLPPPNQPLLLDLIRRHVAIRLDPASGETPPCGICSTCRMMLEEFQRFRERCLKCDYVLTGELRDENGEREEEFDPGMELMCHLCRMAFATVAETKTHFQMVHSLEQLHKCSQCPMKFTTAKRLELHRKIHDSERPFRCHLCTADFKSNSLLKRHREKWHEIQRVFECLQCPRVFATEVHLHLHTKSMHVPANLTGEPLAAAVAPPPAKKAKKRVEPTPAVEIAPPVPPLAPLVSVVATVIPPPAPAPQPTPNDNSKPFQCTTCFNRFHFVGSIKRHTRDVHSRQALPAECNPLVPVHPAIATEVPLGTDFYQIEPVQPTDIYQIEPVVPVAQPAIPKPEPFAHYPGTMPCLVALERLDESIIPPIENYEIPVGKFYFHTRQKKVLLQEPPQELLEDDELAALYPGFVQGQSRRVFTCDICHKELATPEGLKRHVARHKAEYDFHCDECGRGFVDKGSLDRHLHLHTNDYPHKCDECPLGFVRPQLLAKHRERFHGPNAKEQLKLQYCPICQRAFGNRSALNTHLKHYHPEQTEVAEDTQQQQQQYPMELDEEGMSSLMADESLLLDDKTAVFGMLL